MEKYLKIILSILLLLCLAKMNYGYYELVRFACLIAFSFLAYQSKRQNNQSEMLIYVALALLFQPFFKIALGRQIWNFVDVIVSIGLLISISFKSNKTESNS